MSYHTKETILKSFEEIQKAWGTILHVCPNVQFSGSGNPITGVLEGSIEVGSNVGQPVDRMSQFSVYHDRSGLFECGRPKIIGKDFWIWRSDYLKMHGSVHVPYKIFTMEPGMSGEDGKTVPARIAEREHTLQLRLRFPSFGISSLLTDEKKVRAALDGAPPEFREQYQTAVDAAIKDVMEWQKVLKEAAAGFEVANSATGGS